MTSVQRSVARPARCPHSSDAATCAGRSAAGRARALARVYKDDGICLVPSPGRGRPANSPRPDACWVPSPWQRRPAVEGCSFACASLRGAAAPQHQSEAGAGADTRVFNAKAQRVGTRPVPLRRCVRPRPQGPERRPSIGITTQKPVFAHLPRVVLAGALRFPRCPHVGNRRVPRPSHRKAVVYPIGINLVVSLLDALQRLGAVAELGIQFGLPTP